MINCIDTMTGWHRENPTIVMELTYKRNQTAEIVMKINDVEVWVFTTE